MENINNFKIALLIDAENISPKYIKLVFDELSKYGIVTIKRIYGDWTQQERSSWKQVLSENALQPIQQFQNSSRKNCSDSTLIIDGMDILYQKEMDAFCIVSSDGDFTRLITRFREDGKYVIGMGEKKSPKSIINACDKFVYLDVETKARKAAKPKNNEKSLDTKSAKLLSEMGQEKVDAMLNAVAEFDTDDSEWANLSDVGNRMTKLFPDFDARNYGFKKLSELVKSTELFEVTFTENKTNGTKTYQIKAKK